MRAQEEGYLQGDQFCHQDQGYQGFQSDPAEGKGRHSSVSKGEKVMMGLVPASECLIPNPTHARGRLANLNSRMGAAPWHQADQLHRGGQLHQETLWDQQDQEHHVHQQDPERGKSQEDKGLKWGPCDQGLVPSSLLRRAEGTSSGGF